MGRHVRDLLSPLLVHEVDPLADRCVLALEDDEFDPAEQGFSARSITGLLGVPHSTNPQSSEAVPLGRPVDPPSALDTGPQRPPPPARPSAPGDGSAAPVTPQTVPERPPPGPPENEQAARLWICGRCRRVGFDPNRSPARAWHTPELCDQRMAKLDAALDDSPVAGGGVWSMRW